MTTTNSNESEEQHGLAARVQEWEVGPPAWSGGRGAVGAAAGAPRSVLRPKARPRSAEGRSAVRQQQQQRVRSEQRGARLVDASNGETGGCRRAASGLKLQATEVAASAAFVAKNTAFASRSTGST